MGKKCLYMTWTRRLYFNPQCDAKKEEEKEEKKEEEEENEREEEEG